MTRSRTSRALIAGVGVLGVLSPLVATATATAATGPADRIDVNVVAHRGASADAPENTLAAVREGVAQDADLVEIDVQRSSDGALVVVHDTTLSRTTDAEERFPDRAPWNVGDFTLAELRTLDAGTWKAAEFAGEAVPTLGEVLDTLAGSGAGLLLEAKAPELYPGIAQDLATELRAHPRWWRSAPRDQQLVVQSFNWEFMEEFHDLAPHLKAGLLGRAELDQLPDLSWADQINPNFRQADAAWVAGVQDAGFEVFVYTVNEVSDMEALIGAGVDGIISDRPAVLRGVVEENTPRSTGIVPAA